MNEIAYYNEIDPFAAQTLRNLIAAGHIAPGVVDERSIEDVKPTELLGYAQCHFFAGVGVWSLALRRAGWPDDRPVWTGSCPCQPFSAAGKGDGFADERHLWPAFNHLISQLRPPTVFGEQVASKDADPWIDLVHTDLEAMDYAFGAIPFPSAGVGAPHIRDRLYWVGHTSGPRLERHAGHGGPARRQGQIGSVAEASVFGGLADHDGGRLQQEPGTAICTDSKHDAESFCNFGGLADAKLQQRQDGQSGVGHEHEARGRQQGAATPSGLRGDLRPGPTNGFWRAADWLICRDGKWRPVEPGTFPLAHGAPARVGRLRAYGNAINAIQAQVFIEAVMDSNLRAQSGAENEPVERAA